MNPVCTKKFHRLQCLIDSCKSGEDRKLKYIIETEDCDKLLDSSDQNGRTLLHYCAEHENTECASLLLQKRPQLLTLQDDDGCTPLHLAAISGNVPFLASLVKEARKYLEEKQFNSLIDCYDNENHTAHHWATVCGEVECIKVLQSAGADPHLPDIHGAHPIHYASQLDTGNRVSVRRSEVIETILSYAPTEKDARDKDGRTPLLWAASSGNAEAIEVLARMKANVLLQDHDGLTALHCAASRGFLDCLECLLELYGSPVDQTDSSGASALFYAVTLGHADCTQFLLQEGSAPNRQDRKGRTSAHCGAAKGQLETLKILSQNGGNMWIKNNRGDLPLHEAIKSGRKELVRWLLEQLPSGAEFPNGTGKTPLHVACMSGNIEMCQVLIDSGMDVNALMKSKNGWMTPLDVCLLKGFRSCAKFILLHGAQPASKLPDGTQFRESSLNEAILDSESHSSSQSFIKEIRVPSKTHLKNITKSVTTSQRVQVFADGHQTPNSCVETTLSTDTRPETIITNVYVNTISDSRKRSTLSKLIRRRNKKRSNSNNSTGRNSVAKDDEEKEKEEKSKFNSWTNHEEEYESNEIDTNVDKKNGELIDDWVEIDGNSMNEKQEDRTWIDAEKVNINIGNSNDLKKIILDENENNEVNTAGLDSKENAIEQVIPQREIPNEDEFINSQELTSKTRSKRQVDEDELERNDEDGLERNGEDELKRNDAEGKEEVLKDVIVENGKEKILDGNEDRYIEVIEYAQVLTDKIIGSGEEVLSSLANGRNQENRKVEDGEENSDEPNLINDAEANDETSSEGVLESEAEVRTPKSSEHDSLDSEPPHRVAFHDTDSNSLHESISADETVIESIDDPAAIREEHHQTFEITDHHHLEDDRMGTSVRRKKSSTRGKRKNPPHCTHKYHFKQSFTTIQPLDLQHVRPKVDTGRSSSCCTKSFSRSSDRMASEYELVPYSFELMKSEKSLRKYYIERKLFEELRELKRCQIRSDRALEKILVKRLIDNFERDISGEYPGMVKYTGNHDYKSFERFLYDQLRQLSKSNQGKMKKYSSEENIVPMPKMFQQEKKPRRTYSAEHLHQEQHQADRFLPLEDNHPIERSPQPGAKFEKPTYHKVNSDVTRTAESLDYAIITRDGSSNIFRKETAIKFDPRTTLPPLSATSTSRLRTVTSQTGPVETINRETRSQQQQQQFSKKIKTTTSKITTTKTINRNGVREETMSSHKVFYSGRNSNECKKTPVKPVELKRKKSQIPPPQKVVISEEEISRRWSAIKEQEKARKNSQTDTKAKTRSSPDLRDCTLIYEVNGSKSAPSHHRKRIHRTISEPKVTKVGKPRK